jgi:HD-like signal output (HDOD) protein
MDNQKLERIRKKITQAIQELPALPVVVTKVLEETQRTNVSAVEIERLIGSDPAIATKTLRVVNSAYYGMSKQICSLSQAIVILGVQQVRNLVLSVGAMSVFRAQSPAIAALHKDYWFLSIASASGSLTLARKKRLPSHEQEVAFVAGLLHDLGRLFLFTNFADTYTEIDRRFRSGEDLEKLELDLLGFTHAQIGQVLAHVWHFPEPLAEIMGSHNGPFNDDSDSLSKVVHVAHQLADQILHKSDAMAQLDPLAADWIDGLDEEMLQIQIEVEAKVHAFEQLYGLLAA